MYLLIIMHLLRFLIFISVIAYLIFNLCLLLIDIYVIEFDSLYEIVRFKHEGILFGYRYV